VAEWVRLSELHFYEVRTVCPETRIEVRITLVSQKQMRGELVEGKPVECSLADTCKGKGNVLCYLRSLRVEARGKPIAPAGAISYLG
jgi:hypothetical protein